MLVDDDATGAESVVEYVRVGVDDGEDEEEVEVIVEVNNRSTDINTFHIFDLCLKTTTQVLIFKEQATMILQFGHVEWKEIAVWA